MTDDKSRALRDVRAYRRARERLHPAVVALDAADVPQTVIARESGLSRDGVRKILARAAKPEQQTDDTEETR